MFRSFLLATVLIARITPSGAAEPALTRVVLSSSGVGQFTFAASVDGRATLPLNVPIDQVDDLLKSLHVDDPAGGRATVRLSGQAPLSETFRTLPFAPDAFASPEALLAGLVGETVRLTSSASAAGSMTGRILAVTEFDAPKHDSDSATIKQHRLTIATDTGFATAILEDTQAVELTSETLRGQIGTALSAIAAQRLQDRRTLQLRLGDGHARTVRFGYVVPTPVWKASYRVTLPAAGHDTARLEGYAVVENLSGRDWDDVDLVLTSGQPVLYHQALYLAVFTQRPDAPVEIPNRLTPAVDAGAVEKAGPAQNGVGSSAPPDALRPQPEALAGKADEETERSPTPAAAAPPPAIVQQAIAQVQFHLSDPVTAASGESLLLPILDRAVPARLVSLFRAESHELHPLLALMLTNDGEGAIPPGLATLFDAEGGFAGDAQLPATQPGEQRLVSFSADLPVRIAAETSDDTLLVGATAARGVLHLQRREESVTTYRVTTPAASGRTVLIEQPKRDDWTVVQPPNGVADTPTDHRITFDVPAGTTRSVQVVLQHLTDEATILTDAEPDVLLELAKDGHIPPALHAALDRAAALRAELDRRQAALEALATRREAIVGDQERIRQNLKAVPAGDLSRRYVAQLASQETELSQIDKQTEAAQSSVDAAGSALKTFLSSLSL